MVVKEQVKKIKEYLLAQEAEAQLDTDAVPLSDKEFEERVQTIKDIRPTMRDVIQYCYEDGWNTTMVCELMLKACFGESWNDDWLDW